MKITAAVTTVTTTLVIVIKPLTTMTMITNKLSSILHFCQQNAFNVMLHTHTHPEAHSESHAHTQTQIHNCQQVLSAHLFQLYTAHTSCSIFFCLPFSFFTVRRGIQILRTTDSTNTQYQTYMQRHENSSVHFIVTLPSQIPSDQSTVNNKIMRE